MNSTLEVKLKIFRMTSSLLLLAAKCNALYLHPSCNMVGNSESVHKIRGLASIVSRTFSFLLARMSRPICNSSPVLGEATAGAPMEASTAENDWRPK